MRGTYRFGPFDLDTAAYSLRRDGRAVRLERIPMEILILLVRNAGMLVDRKAIYDALWGDGVFVDRDAAINTAIRKIRRALGDDSSAPRFVETVVGKGPRFTAAVRQEAGRGASRPLLLRHGDQQFRLGRGEHLIGRDPGAAVYLDHPSVSRRHALLSVGEGGAVLEDLGSRNGTFVDGRRIGGPTDVEHGAIISVGPITLTLNAPAAPGSTRSLSGSVKVRTSKEV